MSYGNSSRYRATVPGLTLGASLQVAGDTGSSLTVDGPVTLLADATITASADLVFQQQVGGAGGIEKAGPGTLTFGGVNSDSYAGTTTADAGTLLLRKTAGAVAVPDNLRINAGTVRLAAPRQIAPSAGVTLNPVAGPAILDLGGNDQTLASLSDLNNLSGGLVLLGGAALRVTTGTASQYSGVPWIRQSPTGGTVSVTRSGDGVLIGPRPGDANSDGVVNFSDLLILAQNYGKTTGDTYAAGDFDGDGQDGFPDLLILAQNYGRPSGLIRRRPCRLTCNSPRGVLVF